MKNKKSALCCAILLLSLVFSRTAAAAGGGIGRHFSGETLSYNVGVFLFKKVFHCTLNLQPGEKPGEYLATLWGRTQGVVGWLTSYRERLYLSYMEESADGGRLRPRRFEKRDYKGKKVYREVHDFNYTDNSWLIRVYNQNRLVRQERRALPARGDFEDVLSAFYNFRYKAYGEFVRGRWYTLPAFSLKKGPVDFKVRLLTRKEQARHPLREVGDSVDDYLFRLKVNKEVFTLADGVLWTWLSPDTVPQRGVAEDAVGFGDIYGYLHEAKKSPADPTAYIAPQLRLKNLFPDGLK